MEGDTMILITCLAFFIFLVLFTLYCMLKVAKIADEQIVNITKNDGKKLKK